MKKILCGLFGLMLLMILLNALPVHAYTFIGIENAKGANLEVDFHPETNTVDCSFQGQSFSLERPNSNPPVPVWFKIFGDMSIFMAYDQKTGIVKMNLGKISTRETRLLKFKYTRSNPFTVNSGGYSNYSGGGYSGGYSTPSQQREMCYACHGMGYCVVCHGKGRNTGFGYDCGLCDACGGSGKCWRCGGSRFEN